LIALIFSLILIAPLFYGLKFLIKKVYTQTTSESSTKIPEINIQITKSDDMIHEDLSYTQGLLPLSDALKRKEQEQNLKNELIKSEKIIFELEKNLSALKSEVDETQNEYNKVKKGKESGDAISENIKTRKNELKNENDSLQKNLLESLNGIESFSKSTRLNQNQEAGVKMIIGNIQDANKHLETLINSYNQSSSRFLNLYEQYSDLEVEFTRLVEQELSD
jgi:chromosome segregation ATPase